METEKPQKTNYIGEYIHDHDRLRKLSAETKSERLELVSILHWVVKRKMLKDEPAEFVAEIKSRLLKFFTENPNRITFDLAVFEDIYKKNELLDAWQSRGLSVVSQVIHKDIIHQLYI